MSRLCIIVERFINLVTQIADRQKNKVTKTILGLDSLDNWGL